MNGDESSEESSSSCCSKRHGLSWVWWIKALNVNRSEVELISKMMQFITAPHWIWVVGEHGKVFDAEVTESLMRSIQVTHKLKGLILCGINVTSSPAVELFINNLFKKAPNLEWLDMSFNPLLGAGVDSLIKHLSCAPHLETLELVNVKMTPQQVMDLSSAIKQHRNITYLWSYYHDYDGNPYPEHYWLPEDFWKRRYPSLFSHSSNESQPQKQQVDSLSESEDESEDEDEEEWDEEGIIQSEEESAEEMSPYKSEDNQGQILAETRLSIHDSPFPADHQDTVGTYPAPPDPTADPMLAEPSIPTVHGSSHGLTPAGPFSGTPLHNVQYPQHYSSPDIYTYHHSAPSTIFTPGGSLGYDSYLFRGSGSSTVTQDEPEKDSRPSTQDVLSYDPGSTGSVPVPLHSAADPMLATAHGSSHGLVPHVQYSERYSLADIHSPHHSVPSTIFTLGGSLAVDPYLISAPGPSTVTQDQPIDERMWPQTEIEDLPQLERLSLKERDTRPNAQDVPSLDPGTAGPVPVPLHSAGATIRTQTGYLPQRGMQDPPQQRVQPQNTMHCDLNLEGPAVTYPQGIPRFLRPEKISGNSTRPRLHQPQPQSASPRDPHRGNQKSSVLQLPEIPGNSTRPRPRQPQPQSASPCDPHRGNQKSSVPQLPEISGNSKRPRLHQPQPQSVSPRNPHRGDQKSSVPQLPEISGNSTRPRTAPTAARKWKRT